MIASVDMQRMNRILSIDKENLRAEIEAGIRGVDLEAQLAAEGFTSGHEPDSIELSTLGGWIATNASGMKKNRYGNIEQIVENVTLITPGGTAELLTPLPRGSIGIHPIYLMFGSEGNLGLITKAVLKIHPKPEVTKYGSLVFPDIEHGIAFLKELAYSGYVPASIRLVDNIQFRFGLALKAESEGLQSLLDGLKKHYLVKVKGFDPYKIAAATIVMEGSRREVAQQNAYLSRLAKKYSGLPGGADAGRRGYMLTYAIAYIRDFVARFHVIGETFETSVPWSKIQNVCQAVKDRAEQGHRKYGLPGKFYVSYRITQIYHTGVCIYFMYGVYTKGLENPEDTFGKIEHSLREAILENGGSISHHHGVGKLRREFMKDTLSRGSIGMLRRFKQSIDPDNVFGAANNVFGE
jgi:alkyldihydroxyacetonephosphate synthase